MPKKDSYLFLDTETTDKIDSDLVWSDEKQPAIVQLAMILATKEQEIKAEVNILFKPNGWTIQEGARNVHGISEEDCESYGISQTLGLSLFWRLFSRAEMVVCHNAWFDLRMIKSMSYRTKIQIPRIVPCFCTMKATTPICQLPGKYGHKWPKLEEAYKFLFNEDLKDTHDAMADVKACMKIFYHLQSLQTTPLVSNGPS